MQATWKEAASIIVVAAKRTPRAWASAASEVNDPTADILRMARGEKARAVESRDFEVLLMKRDDRSSFCPNTYVFPGGASDPQDRTGGWIDTLQEYYGVKEDVFSENDHELIKNFLNSFTTLPPPRPEMFAPRGPVDHSLLPMEVGMKIAALRELFEETGILLGRPRNSKLSVVQSSGVDDVPQGGTEFHSPSNVAALREAQDSHVSFQTLLHERQLLPDLGRIWEWSNWLTPAFKGGRRRYDTLFYLTCLDRRPPCRLPKSGEVAALQWSDPEDALRDHAAGRLTLPPPQVYELARLARFTTYQQVKLFAQSRQNNGVERWTPYIVKSKDGWNIKLLPGDDLFPQNYDITLAGGAVGSIDQTAAESLAACTNLHRMHAKGVGKGKIHMRTYVKNVTLPGGQFPALEMEIWEGGFSDDLFPQNYDITLAGGAVGSIDQTAAESLAACTNLHRMHAKGVGKGKIHMRTYVKNVTLPGGQFPALEMEIWEGGFSKL